MGKKKQQRPRRPFIEGTDSYSDEYKYWAKSNIIKRLVGIFEVSREHFASTLEDMLVASGVDGYSIVRYKADQDNTDHGTGPISSTGCAVAVRDSYGKVAPLVFVQSDVQSVAADGEASDEFAPGFADAMRLLVLFHELGHADDISKSINYNHKDLRIDFAAAEAYAHGFVFRMTRKHHYPWLVQTYLKNVERMAKSEYDAERVGAEQFLNEHDVAGIRAWITEYCSPAGRAKWRRQAGR